jgi:putative DNA-invertase from lambdoid prophage Rac
VIRTVINNMTFDGSTKDPVQKAVRDALIAFMAATAQKHRPKQRKPPSGPASITPRPTVMAIAVASRVTAEQLETVQNMLGQDANVV